MRKITIILLALVMAGICRAADIPPDSNYVWHVSKDGNNDQTGHSYGQAKLTIAAALTASASGDTLVLWPGVYTEQVNFSTAAKSINMKGLGPGSIIEASASRGSATVTLYNNCTLEDLLVRWVGTIPTSTTQGVAISAVNVKGVNLKNIISDSNDACFVLTSTTTPVGVTVDKCHFNGVEYGIYMSSVAASRSELILKDSHINAAAWTVCSTAPIDFYGSCMATIDNCIIDCNGGYVGGSSWPSAGILIVGNNSANANSNPKIVVNDSVIRAHHSADSQPAYAIQSGAFNNSGTPYTSCLVNNCVLNGTTYDLCNTDANYNTLVVSNSLYDSNKVYGTIIQGGSGWSAGITTAVPTAIQNADAVVNEPNFITAKSDANKAAIDSNTAAENTILIYAIDSNEVYGLSASKTASDANHLKTQDDIVILKEAADANFIIINDKIDDINCSGGGGYPGGQ